MDCRRILVLASLALVFQTDSPALAKEPQRVPMVVNERGGPPIARWRIHAKVLESARKQKPDLDLVLYLTKADMTIPEAVIIFMVLDGVDLQSAVTALQKRNFKGAGSADPSRLLMLLQHEEIAGELKISGSGLQSRLVAVWPPPG